MAAKKTEQAKQTKQTKQAKQAKQVYTFTTDMFSLQKQVAQMNRMLDDFVACSKTEDEWLATLVALSVEAAKVAKFMGFDRQAFIDAFLVTTDEVYNRKEKKPAKPVAKKPAKKAVKKPAKKVAW